MNAHAHDRHSPHPALRARGCGCRPHGPELLEAVHTRGVLTSGDTLGYALGLAIGTYRGLPTVSHGGAFVGFRADLVRFPTERFSVVCLCNVATANPSRLARRVADLYLRGREGEVSGFLLDAGRVENLRFVRR